MANHYQIVFNIPSWNINNIFSLNIPLMFLLCFFLFSLIVSPCFFFVYLNLSVFLNLIHFCQILNLLSGEHHKAINPPYSRNCQVPQKKKTGKKIAVLPFLATKRQCSLLITSIHYSLLVIQISSRSQISSRYTNF